MKRPAAPGSDISFVRKTSFFSGYQDESQGGKERPFRRRGAGFWVLEGVFFIKVLGGLQYPFWRADPQVARNYGEMAGIPSTGNNFWQHLAMKSYQRR